MKHAFSFAGLFDLAQAFEWVWGNIAYFGGMKTSGYIGLTLVGQGSGAMAVSLLQMAVPNISKFKEVKMILNGASFLTLKALEGVDEEGNSYVNNLRLTNMLADALDCPTPLWKNRNATITCLKGETTQ
ncbi:hypothetical protein JTE90_022704 [Oedothorax gibbosus]|uniref:Carboxylesterase type B domain-containing protein n=1 Tax=Oedothorax gibbosus TaxID=931172 RepID=A0AAV6UKA9_9ARAC|nr:hypothetical protein JTE90_022704 [Oedothorax gibbosus]